MYVFQIIFGLVLLCCSILHSHGSRKDGNDFSEDEKLLEKYFKYKYELAWTWSVDSFCRVFRPRSSKRIGDTLFTLSRQKREIVLEAPGCVKMEIETLTCWYTKRSNSRNSWRYRKRIDYVSGLNGEIYKLGSANGICDEYKTAIITDRIHSVHSTSATSQQPKLLGVARVFEAANAIRVKTRQRREDRSSGNISDSDEDTDDPTQIASTSNRNEYMTFEIHL